MKFKLTILLLACPGLLCAGSFNATSKGTASAPFLKLGVGARAVGMGEAYSAVADDAGALFWNPGALTRIEKRSATFMHASSMGSSHFDYAAYAQKFGEQGVFGSSFHYLSAGEIMETSDTTGANVRAFTPYDMAFSLGYARSWAGFSFGLSGKAIHSELLASDDTAAFDFGVLSPAYLGGKLRIAFTAANMGPNLKLERDSLRLPFALRLGSAYRINERWLTSLDVGLPNDNNPYAALGVEYLRPLGPDWSAAGRMGFNSRTIGDVSGFTGYSVGAGVVRGGLGVDYAFVPFGGLGNVHRFSLTGKF